MASNSEMLGQSKLDMNTLSGSCINIIVLMSACCDDQCLLELSCSGVAGVLTKLKDDCSFRQSSAGCACIVDQVFADGLLLISHVSRCSIHRLHFIIVCTLQD